MFRYLTPRKGTGTRCGLLFLVYRTSSDTLLPVRGRKHCVSVRDTAFYTFRHLTPREGTETAMSHLRYDTTNLFRCPTPREGTETR